MIYAVFVGLVLLRLANIIEKLPSLFVLLVICVILSAFGGVFFKEISKMEPPKG